MPSTLDWKNSVDPRDIIHVVVQALVEGKLVVLPTETSYMLVASGLRQEAVLRLLQSVSERIPASRPIVMLRSSQEALDYVPDLSAVAARMVRRGWPGPLGLELCADSADSLASCLSREAFSRLMVEERFLPMRVTAHEAIDQIMRLIPGPLVATPLLDSANEAICLGGQAAKHAAAENTLIVDDGQTHFSGLATRVRVDGHRCRITEPGVVDRDKLNRLSELFILLVCTGNTCRSPMAEALMRELIAKRFPELAGRVPKPYFIASAGLSAYPGGAASPEAIKVMQQRGLNISDHQSRAVTEHALRHADLVLTMTSSHRHAILDRAPHLAEKVKLVGDPLGGDVSDPFGGAESAYAVCADQIEEFLAAWVDRIEEAWLPDWEID